MAVTSPAITYGGPGEGRNADRADRVLIAAWLISVGAHVVLFTFMVAVPWIVQRAGPPGGPLVATTDLRDLPRPSKFSMASAPSFNFQNSGSGGANTTNPSSVRFAPQGSQALGGLNQAPSQPQMGIVGIGAGGGEFAKYGVHVGGGGPGPQFFGVGGEARAARRVVYIVDRSGSMLGIFGDCVKELKRSIDELRKSQKYHVIFYSDDPPLEVPPGRMVNAIRASKETTFNFIEGVMPGGSTHPIEAMRIAFTHNPDIIFFLSDGEIPEGEQLKEKLREWNRRKNVRIFTIAYVSPGGRQLLEDIAREHDGAFRFVSELDLDHP